MIGEQFRILRSRFGRLRDRTAWRSQESSPGLAPVILVRDGRPVAVVMDVDSYEEAEVALAAGA